MNVQYYQYLHSEKWAGIKQRVRERDENNCQICGRNYNLQVHHKTYDHIFQEENHLSDLILLCRSCHEDEHSSAPTFEQIYKLLNKL